MEWKDRRESRNVEDRRSLAVTGAAIGGGTLILALILGLVFGVNPQKLLEQAGANQPAAQQGERKASPEEEERAKFVKVILADTEDVWGKLFAKMGKKYQEPTLVLFSGQVNSACGQASAAVGPFYCPGDKKVYLDLGFFNQLKQMGASGDFAQAYVVAHEIGHHIQNLLGITDRIHAQQGRISKEEYNKLSVRLELQADFLAGVFAHHAAQNIRGFLNEKDVEDGLRAAYQIGDDTLQKQAQGYVVPESFTHGSSRQRVLWFKKGLATGDLSQGDTFDLTDRQLDNP